VHKTDISPIRSAFGDNIPATLRVHVPEAASGLGLLLQSGVGVDCLTGISLERLLVEELQLGKELRNKLNVFLLDGKPVDEPEKAVIDNGCRLALAAGVPGVVGMAMRSGSPVAAMRPSITHHAGENEKKAEAAPGRIELALFSLALPFLAPHMLRRGILVTARKLEPYLRPTLMQSCIINNMTKTVEQSRHLLAALAPENLVLMTAILR